MTTAKSPFHDALLAIVPQLRAYARTLCRAKDVADDLVQETLLKAWEKKGDIRDLDCLKSWAFTIMRNEFNAQWRRRKFMVEDEDGYWAETLTTEASQTSFVDLQDLARELSKINDLQREAIMLVFVNGLSYEEASEVASCPIGTMKSRVNRARKELCERLGLDDVANGRDKGDDAVQLPDGLVSLLKDKRVEAALG